MRGDVTLTSERLNLNQLIGRLRFANRDRSVSYTHLTLPTIRMV